MIRLRGEVSQRTKSGGCKIWTNTSSDQRQCQSTSSMRRSRPLKWLRRPSKRFLKAIQSTFLKAPTSLDSLVTQGRKMVRTIRPIFPRISVSILLSSRWHVEETILSFCRREETFFRLDPTSLANLVSMKDRWITLQLRLWSKTASSWNSLRYQREARTTWCLAVTVKSLPGVKTETANVDRFRSSTSASICLSRYSHPPYLRIRLYKWTVEIISQDFWLPMEKRLPLDPTSRDSWESATHPERQLASQPGSRLRLILTRLVVAIDTCSYLHRALSKTLSSGQDSIRTLNWLKTAMKTTKFSITQSLFHWLLRKFSK